MRHSFRYCVLRTAVVAAALTLTVPLSQPSIAAEELVENAAQASVAGSLTYRARIALPDSAVAVVELRQTFGAVLVEQRIPLRGRQVPVAFTMHVAMDAFTPNTAYEFRGAILVDGRIAWVSPMKPVRLAAGTVDLGEILLKPQQLTLPFTARGNEPGWRVTVGKKQIVLVTDNGSARETFPTPPPQSTVDVTSFVVPAKSMTIAVAERPCADSMSGMFYPLSVSLELAGTTRKGCGGDPKSLLTGGEWLVEAIDGRAVVGHSHVIIKFGADGRVSGTGSCNSFTAGYTLSGEGLKIDKAASTMRACEDVLMEQEHRFLDTLAAVHRFEIAADGALVLLTSDGRPLVARR
jgi:heat shock protein HslJ/uncharacterized lipoprotein YbaY